MHGEGLDKPSAVFIEWDIGKMEAANFSHELITYYLNTPKQLWNIGKIKNWFIHILYIDVTQKGCHLKRGNGVPQNSD